LSDRGDLSEAEAKPAPGHLHNLVNTLLSRVGVTGGSMIVRFAPGPQFEPVFLTPGALGEKDFDATKIDGWGVGGFKEGAGTKVAGRDARVLTYRFGAKGGKGSIPVTLWLDAKTLLPLKSVVVNKSENLQITETYTAFKLDPKIDAKAFALDYQVNDAEKLFRAMEEKIKAAKAVEVTFDFTATAKGKKEKFTGSLLFTQDNKARLKMRVPEEGKDAIEMVSDGKQMKVAYPPQETLAKVEALQTPTDLHNLFSTMVSGPSLVLTYDMLNVPEWFPGGGQYKGPGRWPFRVVEFEFVAGAGTKVGGRDAKVIIYRVLDLPGPGGGDCTFTLWIDAETLLPLKRLIASDGSDEEPGSITEVCNINLAPKINAGAFALPK
jgi:outer membrane lipoprotein-sorting protein